MVGLPDTAVKESEDRVLSALMNTGLRRPEMHTTINLAPGDLRKEGALYDLPIAIGLCVALRQVDPGRCAGLLPAWLEGAGLHAALEGAAASAASAVGRVGAGPPPPAA